MIDKDKLKGSRWERGRRADLMANSSTAERSVYSFLKNIGINVIRQYPINTGRKQYFCDLYLPDFHAVIEIDGGYHFTKNQRRLDTNRSSGLRRLGYHVLRLSNKDARKKEKILSKIKSLQKKRLNDSKNQAVES